jgi:hypothetical protein
MAPRPGAAGTAAWTGSRSKPTAICWTRSNRRRPTGARTATAAAWTTACASASRRWMRSAAR